MRSAVKYLVTFVSLVCLILLSFVQLFGFMYILRSEGPHLMFLIWFLLAVFFTFIHFSLSKERKVLRLITLIFSTLIVAAGIITVLIQVQVATRSLAEAWLERARSGGAFGFFSFFASEIYALFIFVQVLFFSQKKYVSYLFSIAATASLCFGLVFNNSYLLLLVFVFSFFVLVFYTPFSISHIRERILRMIFPLTAAILVSSIIAIGVWKSPDSSMPTLPLNVTPLVQRIAPQFPLLTNMPGYGFSAETQKMPRSTYLTTRSLFEVNGAPLSTHYFMTGRFLNWRGNSWSKDTSGKSKKIPVSYLGDDQRATAYSVSESVLLTLLEDFYTSFPVKANTVELRIQKPASDLFSADESDGLLFAQSVQRGMQVLLLQSSEKNNYTEEEALLLSNEAVMNYTSHYAGSAQWKNLADSLIQQSRLKTPASISIGTAGDDAPSIEQRLYLETLLEYFSQNFTYSLSTGAPLSVQNPIEHFLFESKKGFCIYFASAFVLFAREADIPARLVEGFRVQLDETGKGRITGSSAHAWAEVWIDGQWRIFEPTPPFMSDDPFAYVRENDRNTRIQLEQLFSPDKDLTESGVSFTWNLVDFFTTHYLLIIILLVLVMLFVSVLRILLPLFSSPSMKIRRKARNLVKKYAKKGVLCPDRTGWLIWKDAVAVYNKEDALIADLVIYNTYCAK